MTDPDLAAAWAEVHDNAPDGWYVGRPGFERPTELRCVQEMARCLGELKAGRWPGKSRGLPRTFDPWRPNGSDLHGSDER